MNRVTRGLIAAAAIAGVAVGGVAVAGATGGDDDGNDVAITGAALEQASAAALAHTGGGTVSETEVEDEESYYEVEVTLDDGSQIDVHLDEAFAYLSEEGESQPDDA